MTTCFPSSNNQRDSATMLYLRAPLPSSYSENMMTYMNFSTSSETNTSRQETLSNYVGSRNVDHEFNMVNPMAGVSSILQGTMNSEGEGLSLTLSTHEPSQMDMSSLQYLSSNPNFSSFLGCNPSISGENRGHNGPFENNDDSQSKQLRYSYNPASVIPSSKYLKLAQELLDQVVNVKQAIMEQHKRDELVRTAKETNGESSNRSSDPSAESTKTFTCELSAAKKQEVQDKTTKLLTMLDEVDRRYRQYYHQMQIVVSAFDTIAGSGAAKPYTALALKTISRQFRFLRDAINGQIRVARKSLGEEDSSDNGVGISRLRYVDQQLRQQRALQQLGMMQSHNWRPQRGLPESSVTILRAWLFEHFLHPYPKDSEKTMLARQTGLTRSQVSNWFINARVRLWKPMVEEMYKKEVDDVNIDTNSSESAQKALNTDELHQTATSTETKHCKTGQPSEQNSNHVHDIEMVGPNTDGPSQNLDQGPPSMDDRGLYPDTLIQSNYGDERFISAAYEISELERFESGNGVSLTLGLQGGIQTLGFDFTDSGNRQREFVPSCVLHDFVA